MELPNWILSVWFIKKMFWLSTRVSMYIYTKNIYISDNLILRLFLLDYIHINIFIVCVCLCVYMEGYLTCGEVRPVIVASTDCTCARVPGILSTLPTLLLSKKKRKFLNNKDEQNTKERKHRRKEKEEQMKERKKLVIERKIEKKKKEQMKERKKNDDRE